MVSYYDKRLHRFTSNPLRRNREKPNSMRKYPTISFRTSGIDDEALRYLIGLAGVEKRSEFICEAINTNFMLRRKNPLIFLRELVRDYPKQAKHLVRVECRKNRKAEDLIFKPKRTKKKSF